MCQYLTDSADGRKYWNKLKQRLIEEGNETVTNCHQLKMPANDGKMRKTDCATVEQLLRLIQSIPSKKAEPLKQWLAKVGSERLEETVDPEKAMERAIDTYRQKGYSEAWSGKTVQQYKKLKGLHKESLRDNMTNTELVLNQLAEISATELSKSSNPVGLDATKSVAKSGGEVAANARKDLERRLGRSVISSTNAQTPDLLDDSKK